MTDPKLVRAFEDAAASSKVLPVATRSHRRFAAVMIVLAIVGVLAILFAPAAASLVLS